MNHSSTTPVWNAKIRRRIVDLIYTGKDGHLPSAFSIVDIVSTLYRHYLKVDPKKPDWEERDYFILSKGHGCVALYTVLAESGFIGEEELAGFCRKGGILGEHPDRNKIPGVEASTGSLGHGFPFAMGIALGNRIAKKQNNVYVVVGDGECHEGSIWEAAHVAANYKLGRMCVFVDWNQSGAQLLPHDDLPAKWKSFGFNTVVIDGHSEAEIRSTLDNVEFQDEGTPTAIIARTTKGKGVPMIEGHGPWHHRIPNAEEYQQLMDALS
jgi:transketolase